MRRRSWKRRRAGGLRPRKLGFESFEPRCLLAADLWGVVWNDANGDGHRQDGEPPLAEWRVFLDVNGNGQRDDGERSELTNAQGRYHFGDVATGDHTIALAVRDGWTMTAPQEGAYQIHVEDGDVIDSLRFGVRRVEAAGRIAGAVWNDLDGDGQRDDGEPPLTDWPVYLDAGEVWIQNEVEIWPPPPVHVAFTDDHGVYRFNEVGLGDHSVTVDVGDGWKITAPESGSYQIVVEAGQITEGLIFGLQAPEVGELAGTVWNDLDGDGQRDEGEPPLADWLVYLDGPQWQPPPGSLDPNAPLILPAHVAYTNADGVYRFEDVIVGDHTLFAGTGDGWTVTAPENGHHEVRVEADQVIEGLDFGLKAPEFGQLAGLVWNDVDGDGQRDNGEPPLAEWPAFLDGGDLRAGPLNSPILPPGLFAVTDKNGVYRFEHVVAGEHVVTIGDRDGWKVTAPPEGGYNVAVGVDEVIDGLDFGLQATTAWILGAAWNDLNGDGVWDQEEPPLVDWLIYLNQNGNGQHDDGERRVRTSNHGGYALQVAPGENRVAQSLPDGWVGTFPADGDHLVSIAAGEVADGIRFGAQLLVTLDSPHAARDEAFTPQDMPVEIAVLANDNPGPGGAWDAETLAIVEPPKHGSVHISLPLGVITYVPQPGYFGRDAFAYTVANEEGAVSNVAEAAIKVGLREHPWQNPRMRCDVDDSGNVSILDVIAEVHELREGGARLLPMPDANLAGEAEAAGAAPAVHGFYDVNGDDMVSVGDLLDVITQLRNDGAAAEGETGDPSATGDEPNLAAVLIVPASATQDPELVDDLAINQTTTAPLALEEGAMPAAGCGDREDLAPLSRAARGDSLEEIIDGIAADVLLAQ